MDTWRWLMGTGRVKERSDDKISDGLGLLVWAPLGRDSERQRDAHEAYQSIITRSRFVNGWDMLFLYLYLIFLGIGYCFE